MAGSISSKFSERPCLKDNKAEGQWAETPDANADDLSSVPGPTWWKGRTDSKLSPDLHTHKWHACSHMHIPPTQVAHGLTDVRPHTHKWHKYSRMPTPPPPLNSSSSQTSERRAALRLLKWMDLKAKFFTSLFLLHLLSASACQVLS